MQISYLHFTTPHFIHIFHSCVLWHIHSGELPIHVANAPETGSKYLTISPVMILWNLVKCVQNIRAVISDTSAPCMLNITVFELKVILQVISYIPPLVQYNKIIGIVSIKKSLSTKPKNRKTLTRGESTSAVCLKWLGENKISVAAFFRYVVLQNRPATCKGQRKRKQRPEAVREPQARDWFR